MSVIVERKDTPRPKEIDSRLCVFCGDFEPLEGNSTLEFINSYPDLVQFGQVIRDWQDFALLADVAPIAQDHLLLITKHHYLSMASIPENLKEDAAHFIDSIVIRMGSFHPESEVLIFEHGTGIINNRTVQCGGCGRTEHAHLHFLPLVEMDEPQALQLARQVSRVLNMDLREIPPPPNLDFILATENKPYLYLWSNLAASAYVLIQNQDSLSIPSQLLRKLAAIETGEVKDNDPCGWLWQDYILFNREKGSKLIQDTLKRWKGNL